MVRVHRVSDGLIWKCIGPVLGAGPWLGSPAIGRARALEDRVVYDVGASCCHYLMHSSGHPALKNASGRPAGRPVGGPACRLAGPGS